MSSVPESGGRNPEQGRRAFLQRAVAGTAALALPRRMRADEHDLSAVRTEVKKRHHEAVERLQEWIRQPSIAAENRGMTEGCDLTMRLLRDAGFGEVKKLSTDGQPGIFDTVGPSCVTQRRMAGKRSLLLVM